MNTILIVDDSRLTRNFHAAILTSAGYTVLTATDGADGLEKLLLRGCDLILTDINMQGIDGYEFIRRVRSSAGHQNVPIVILSTEGQSKDEAEGYAAGANLYITKPISSTALIGHVRLLLGRVP